MYSWSLYCILERFQNSSKKCYKYRNSSIYLHTPINHCQIIIESFYEQHASKQTINVKKNFANNSSDRNRTFFTVAWYFYYTYDKMLRLRIEWGTRGKIFCICMYFIYKVRNYIIITKSNLVPHLWATVFICYLAKKKRKKF